MLLDDESTKERQTEGLPTSTAQPDLEAPPPRLSESEPPVVVQHLPVPQVHAPPLDPPEQPKPQGERKLVAGLLLIPLVCLPIAVIAVTTVSFSVSPPVLIAAIPATYYLALLFSLIRNRHIDQLPPFLTTRWNLAILTLLFFAWLTGTFVSLSNGQHEHAKRLAGLITIGAMSALGTCLTAGLLVLLLRHRRAHLIFSKYQRKIKKRFPAVAIYLMIVSPSILVSVGSMVTFMFTSKYWTILPTLTIVHHIGLLVAHARHFQTHLSTSPERFGTLPPHFTSLRHLFIVLLLTMTWVANFLALAYMTAADIMPHSVDAGNIVLYVVAIALTIMEAHLCAGLLAVLVCARHRGSRPLPLPSPPDTELATLPVTNPQVSLRPRSITNLPPGRVSTGSLGAPPPAYSASNRP